jgi:hypothetical protein
MRTFGIVLVQLMLAALALIQVVRLFGSDFGDRVQGAALLGLFVFAMIGVHKATRR